MCFKKYNESIPYDNSINKSDCCKCYYRKYYEAFTCFPGVKCTLITTEDSCNGEYDTHDYNIGCCNSNVNDEPPCAYCACLFCPLTIVSDIITMPFRYIDYKINNSEEDKSNSMVKIDYEGAYDIPELNITTTHP
jgi:hypothetical protein